MSYRAFYYVKYARIRLVIAVYCSFYCSLLINQVCMSSYFYMTNCHEVANLFHEVANLFHEVANGGFFEIGKTGNCRTA